MYNKIIILFVVITSVGCIRLHADEFEAGVKLGANVIKVDGEPFDKKFRFGYHFGVFAKFDVAEQIGIRPELLWSTINTKVGSTLDTLYSFSNVADISLEYLSIPILVTFTPVPILSLQAGPQFGILINPNQTTLKNGSNAFTSGDFSFIIGAQINAGTIQGGIRYIIGLNNINDINNQETWLSQGFQISIGYRFL